MDSVPLIPASVKITPRPYQVAAFNAIYNDWNGGIQRTAVQCPTAWGKTILFSMIAKHAVEEGDKVIIFAHRDDLIQQAYDKFESVAGDQFQVGIVKAARNEISGSQILIVSIQTAVRENRLSDLIKFGADTIIIDECFPKGTSIATPYGEIAIENLMSGDKVLTWDENSGNMVCSTVVSLMQRIAPNRMVRLMIGGATIICTENHPFATPTGWVSAKNLSVDTEIYVDKSTFSGNMYAMQDAFYLRERASEVFFPKKGKDLLQQGMCQAILPGSQFFDYGENKSQICIGENEISQPDAFGGMPYKDVRNFEKNRPQAGDSRGQRETYANSSGITVEEYSDTNIGVYLQNKNRSSVRLSHSLQDRFSIVGSTTGNRDRWPISSSFKETGAGSEETSVPGISRVDSVEILESESYDGFGELCPDGFVYNIEVADTHTYVANGVVVHNCHHGASDGYQKVLEGLGCFTEDGPKLLGVSATLRREDGKVLGDTYQNICYQDDILDMIKGGYLKDIQCIAIKVQANLDAVGTVAGDFAVDQLDAALDKANTPYHVVQGYKEHAMGRKTVVFTTTVKAAYKTAAEFVRQGVPAEAIDGTDSPIIRAEKQGRFQRGETIVLCNCALLTEGWDAPDIDCVIMACPTKSTTKFIQCLGRGLRKYPGKSVCLLLDVCGVVLGKRHKIVSAASLFDVEGDLVEKTATITKALSLKDKLAAEEEERATGYRVAIPVDMFPVQTGFHWLQGKDGSFILSLANGIIKVHRAYRLANQDGDSRKTIPGAEAIPLGQGDRDQESEVELYSVVVTRNRESIALATNIGLEFAQNIAEDFIRNNRVSHLVDKNARWRDDPISSSQKQMLAGFGITKGLDSLTKGEASDLITVEKTAKADLEAVTGTIIAELATNKQLWFLRRSGFHPDPGMTKLEAIAKIGEIKRRGF